MKDTDSNFSFLQRSELWLSASFLAMLVVLIIPLPTFLLDMFLACNIAAAILLLLVTLGARKPLDIASFPSLLLLLTLFRLSLNVATTRLILLDANAGKIVLTFGDFVVGGKPTIADLSLCSYLYWPEEIGVDFAPFKNINRWLGNISALPGWKAPYDLMPGHPLPA